MTPGPWEAVEVGIGGAYDNPVGVYEVWSGRRVRVAEHLFEADAKLCAVAPAMRDALQVALGALREAELLLTALYDDGVVSIDNHEGDRVSTIDAADRMSSAISVAYAAIEEQT